MIVGVGTDIIEIARIQLAITRQGDRFLQEIFTLKEQEYCLTFKNHAFHFAGRFAGKEAILKAAGTGLRSPITWHDIEILNCSNGQPQVRLAGHLGVLLENLTTHLSISHSKSHATAVAIIERGSL